MNIKYFITNEEGYIIRKGSVNPISLEARKATIPEGKTLHIGSANADTQRVVDGVLVTLDRPLSSSSEYIAEQVRQERNVLRQETDWTQVSDLPFSDSKKTEWRTYRQALRDLPTHSNWPELLDSDWPTPPS